MTTYAIGDVQGCYDSLRRLLDKLTFDPSTDYVWFAGDIINRGPQSLETLRFIISLGNSARTILGNHECHFLASARGHKTPYKTDTFQDIINANNASELIDWVRTRPFLYHDASLGYSMVHAGLPPQWSLVDAKQYAKELQDVFRSNAIDDFLAAMYGNEPTKWNAALSGNERLRFMVNCFTRLRFMTHKGELELKEKNTPSVNTEHLTPWFKVPARKTASDKILFGHWSTLGLNRQNNTICLDTGCLWGGQLSALKLDGSEEVISLDCEQSFAPS